MTTSPVDMAAKRWAPESRVKSAIKTLEEHGHLLTEDQIRRIARVVAAPR